MTSTRDIDGAGYVMTVSMTIVSSGELYPLDSQIRDLEGKRHTFRTRDRVQFPEQIIHDLFLGWCSLRGISGQSQQVL